MAERKKRKKRTEGRKEGREVKKERLRKIGAREVRSS